MNNREKKYEKVGNSGIEIPVAINSINEAINNGVNLDSLSTVIPSLGNDAFINI